MLEVFSRFTSVSQKRNVHKHIYEGVFMSSYIYILRTLVDQFTS